MFDTPNSFSLHIEQMVQESKGMGYMDAVLKYCEDNFLEPSDISGLINQNLKDKIAVEMMDLNFLPKQAQLDI